MDQFITSLYTLAEHCDYGELRDQLIRDRIVVGLRDAKISEKLQLDPALTLEKAVTQARQKEAVHEQQSIVRSYVLSENKIDSVKFRQRHSQNTQRRHTRDKPKTQNGDKPRCTRCEAYRHIVGVSAQLGIQSAEVVVEKDTGFDFVFPRRCKVNDRDGESDDESDAYLGTIDSESAVLSSISSNSDEPWIIDLKVGQGFIRFKIDCGADVTVISEDLKIGKLP